MSLIATLARLEAVRAGRAQPLATRLHRHLSERPLVLVPLTTAGETGAPLGALVGTERERPRLLYVPQPRDRELRFGFLAALAAEVLPYVESFAADVETVERKETDPESGKKVTVEAELCRDAPQLLVPSTAGVEFVRLLGRSMRFRRTAEQDPDEPYPAPARVPLLGRWLTHFGERARVPGSALLLPMTGLLGRHWATGQSRMEEQHLGALLGWLDPPEGADGAAAALAAELERDEDGQLRHPPAGPATDPAFDNKLLAPAIERYDAARLRFAAAEDPEHADALLAALHEAEHAIGQLVLRVTRPTWDAVWHGIDLLRTLPEAPYAAERWTRDRLSYTSHRDRLAAGEPPQPRRDDAVTAARKLAAREREQARLDAQEALDDPLVMAERRLAGEAFHGHVEAVEMTYTEGRRPRPRPVLTVRTDDLPQLAERTPVFRVLEGKPQTADFTGRTEDGALLLTVRDRMGRGAEPDPGSVPAVGETLCFTLFPHDQRPGPGLPDAEATPWTHGGPPDGVPVAEAPDAVTEEDVL
ncbi:hypothetical protein [Streptomyces sp. NRRL F-5630]|uniref:hypothetical protein n=1 Tax=Streptomyces sp. NRRL F-5630 TaxID=1463864 RepID=UPI003EBD9219